MKINKNRSKDTVKKSRPVRSIVIIVVLSLSVLLLAHYYILNYTLDAFIDCPSGEVAVPFNQGWAPGGESWTDRINLNKKCVNPNAP